MDSHWDAPDQDRVIRVVHHVRGRLRVRAPASAGETLSNALRSAPGIRSAVWSPRTRSLLVLYDAESTTVQAIVDALRDRADLGETAAPWEEGPLREQPPTVAEAVVGTVSELDQRVRRSTAGMLGVRTLIPAALTLWAVSEIMRGRVAPVPWSAALWYAHGLFRDYNPPA
jgi:Heavy metal associated domain 2